MNQYIKKCFQCGEFHQNKNVKHFPSVKEIYEDGRISEAPDRYYCKECMSTWGDAYDGMSYDEWSSVEQPITVFEGGRKIIENGVLI